MVTYVIFDQSHILLSTALSFDKSNILSLIHIISEISTIVLNMEQEIAAQASCKKPELPAESRYNQNYFCKILAVERSDLNVLVHFEVSGDGSLGSLQVVRCR